MNEVNGELLLVFLWRSMRIFTELSSYRGPNSFSKSRFFKVSFVFCAFRKKGLIKLFSIPIRGLDNTSLIRNRAHTVNKRWKNIVKLAKKTNIIGNIPKCWRISWNLRIFPHENKSTLFGTFRSRKRSVRGKLVFLFVLLEILLFISRSVSSNEEEKGTKYFIKASFWRCGNPEHWR